MASAKSLIGWGALGGGALAAAAVLEGNRRVRAWETLSCEDAPGGEFIDVEGVRLHYEHYGSGDHAVILLHGFLCCTHSWRHNIPALAPRFTVYALDLMGFGYSARVAERRYSIEEHARLVGKFMDAVGVEQAAIAGHSMGAIIALRLAHDCPDRVTKLVLISGAPYWKGLPASARLMGMNPWISRAVLATWANERAVLAVLKQVYGDPARVNPDDVPGYARPLRVKGTADALLAMAGSPYDIDRAGNLAAIRAPALLIWGDRDDLFPVADGERLARELPNSRLVVVEGTGHAALEERPDVVNPLLLDFLVV